MDSNESAEMKSGDTNCGNCSYCNKESFDLKRCADCKTVSYCDRTCQKKDWSIHKKICRNKKQNEDVSSSTSNKKEQGKASGVDKSKETKLNEKAACFYCDRLNDNLKACARCKTAVYCDKLCQTAHWPQHKRQCGQLCSGTGSKSMDNKNAENRNVALSPYSGPIFDVPPTPRSPSSKTCYFCKKHISKLRKCSKCEIAVYCDERCMVNHRLEHKTSCENLPFFKKVLDFASETLADYYGCNSTEIVFPPLPHPIFGPFVESEGVALLVQIVEPYPHPSQQAVIVKDVKGEKAPMIFNHPKDEQLLMLPKTLAGNLTPGNFIRWFCPRWFLFLDGTIGFHVVSLSEIEILHKVTKCEILLKEALTF